MDQPRVKPKKAKWRVITGILLATFLLMVGAMFFRAPSLIETLTLPQFISIAEAKRIAPWDDGVSRVMAVPSADGSQVQLRGFLTDQSAHSGARKPFSVDVPASEVEKIDQLLEKQGIRLQRQRYGE